MRLVLLCDDTTCFQDAIGVETQRRAEPRVQLIVQRYRVVLQVLDMIIVYLSVNIIHWSLHYQSQTAKSCSACGQIDGCTWCDDAGGSCAITADISSCKAPDPSCCSTYQSCGSCSNVVNCEWCVAGQDQTCVTKKAVCITSTALLLSSANI